MPACAKSGKRVAAVFRESRKRTTAREWADSDYEQSDEEQATLPGPSGPVLGKRGPKTANEARGHLASRKRARENADLADKKEGPSRMTLHRNKKGLTKKARAVNFQKSVADIFQKAVPAGIPVAPPNGIELFTPAHPLTFGAIPHAPGLPPVQHQPIVVDSESECEILDSRQASLGCEIVDAFAARSSAAGKPMDVEEIGTSVAPPAPSVVTAIMTTEDQDAVSSSDSDSEEDAAALSVNDLSLNTINIAYDTFRLKLERYKASKCSNKAIAKDTTGKIVAQKVMVIALLEYNKQCKKLRIKRVNLAAEIDAAPPIARRKLRQRLAKLKPEIAASTCVSHQHGKTTYWASQLRTAARMFLATGELPENKQGQGGRHASHIDNPDVKQGLEAFVKKLVPPEKGGLGPKERLTPQRLRSYANNILLPRLEIETRICESTAFSWMKKLGYRIKRYQKGIYFDGHERPDVVEKRKEFVSQMLTEILPLSYQYEDVEPTAAEGASGPRSKTKKQVREIPPKLGPGQKIHYPIFHDETAVHANDQSRFVWEKEGEHELRDKSRGRIVHVSDFIIEHCGRLRLTPAEIERERQLPRRPLSPAQEEQQRNAWRLVMTAVAKDAAKEGERWSKAAAAQKKVKKSKRKTTRDVKIPNVPATDRTFGGVDWSPPPPPSPFPRYRCESFDARRIIYPGANHDAYWDMPQLIEQTRQTLDIFEAKYPDGVGVFIFDCSSAHEAFASDALIASKMNRNPGGQQPKMHSTVNPATGLSQSMVFMEADAAVDRDGKSLTGLPKGMEQVLRERNMLPALDAAAARRGGGKVVAVCNDCSRSQKARDRDAKARREALHGSARADDVEEDGDDTDTPRASDCCMQRALECQPDFKAEKPLLQVLIEKRGHKCLFLPRFHCELNPIEMYWCETKRRFRERADGTFSTAKRVVPECLDAIPADSIRRFFRHCYRYMDAYRQNLNPAQAAYAVKKYTSHRRIPASIMMDINIISRQ